MRGVYWQQGRLKMYKLKTFKFVFIAILGLIFSVTVIAETEKDNDVSISGIGSAVTDAQLVKWDISVFFDGENLPKGSGTLEEGEEIYQAQCAMCHGEFGESVKNYPKILGGSMEEFIQVAKDGGNNVSLRGINNLWGHAPTLYDFIRRAMPFFAPQSLTDDQTYSVTGYVLMLAEVIDDGVEKMKPIMAVFMNDFEGATVAASNLEEGAAETAAEMFKLWISSKGDIAAKTVWFG